MADIEFAAIDLGAESGRAILSRVSDSKLTLEEVHRFPNGPTRVGESLHWNVLRLYNEIVTGLGMIAKDRNAKPKSIGLDTWGVDFGLLGEGDELLGIPHNYRDPRTNGMLEHAFSVVPRDRLFDLTGIQFMQFNSLFQLIALRKASPSLLKVAKTFLTIPDLLNFWLTGRKVCEFSNATTTQMYDPRAKGWAKPLFEAFDLPLGMMPEIVQPGATLGELRPYLADETGLKGTTVIAPACHDTGSAVAAVPAEKGSKWAFLSSGTWSLMGMEVDAPIIDAKSLRYNFTNEGGVAGTFRFLKNIMGLWLVQESRRTWEKAGKKYDYAELSRLATEARPFAAWVDVDDASFLAPGDMPARIAEFCRKTGQTAPDSPGAYVRCCLESLAMKYRWVAERLEECTGRKIEVIHIVGGGTQNTLLCQMTADATGRTVVTGPIEATAAGNVMMQAIGMGVLADLWAGRALVRRSFELKEYKPQGSAAWADAYGKLCSRLSGV
jgi:rhamnulokinase